MLPDLVTVPTCIACGAMGRDARCEGDCSEHRLPLVAAAELEALRAAGRSARAEIELLEPLVRSLRGRAPAESACPDAYAALSRSARAALRRFEPRDRDRDRDWAAPDTAVGWWCAECGNVDAPQPCLGVCIWRRLDWVNASLYGAEYERCSADLRAARALALIAGRIVTVSPKVGRCVETWGALQVQSQAWSDAG